MWFERNPVKGHRDMTQNPTYVTITYPTIKRLLIKKIYWQDTRVYTLEAGFQGSVMERQIRGVRHDSESRRRPQESLESIKESWNYGNLKRNQLCN